MSNELPYLPFFVADFLVTVGTWPAERTGAYVLALFYQFEHGGLPADDEPELARIFHVSRLAARRIWVEIGGKFHRHEDGLWWNQRLEEVRSTARTQVAKATERGKRGAAGRWGKGANGSRISNAQALPKQCLDDASKEKESTYVPPKPPAVRGASKIRKSRAAPTRHVTIGEAQRQQMREVDRLVASGIDRLAATRQVFK